MSKNEAVSPDDEKWRAERDGDTLIDAQEIRSDPKRLKKALKHLADRRDDAAKAFSLESKTKTRMKESFSKKGDS